MTQAPIAMSGNHRLKRIVRILVLGIALEAGLFALGKRAPVFWRIVHTGMVAVAAGVVVAIIHATRSRAGSDRRRSDRRRELDEP